MLISFTDCLSEEYATHDVFLLYFQGLFFIYKTIPLRNMVPMSFFFFIFEVYFIFANFLAFFFFIYRLFLRKVVPMTFFFFIFKVYFIFENLANFAFSVYLHTVFLRKVVPMAFFFFIFKIYFKFANFLVLFFIHRLFLWGMWCCSRHNRTAWAWWLFCTFLLLYHIYYYISLLYIIIIYYILTTGLGPDGGFANTTSSPSLSSSPQ